MLVTEPLLVAVVGAGRGSILAAPRFYSITPTGKCCRRISRRVWASLPTPRIWPLPKRPALRGQILQRRLPWLRLRAPGIRLLLSRADAVPTCRRRRLVMVSLPPLTLLDVSGTLPPNMPLPILRVLSVLELPCPPPLLPPLVHRPGRHLPLLLRAHCCALLCRLDCKRQEKHHHLARGSRPSPGRSLQLLPPLVVSHPFTSQTSGSLFLMEHRTPFSRKRKSRRRNTKKEGERRDGTRVWRGGWANGGGHRVGFGVLIHVSPIGSPALISEHRRNLSLQTYRISL